MIYIDMDQVLTAFITRCCELLSINVFKYQEKHGVKSTWPFINKHGIKFWTDMKWMDDGQVLWNYITTHYINVSILTAAPTYKLSRYVNKGKNIWINNNLGRVNRIITTIGHKAKYCRFGDILIDDDRINIIPWRERGGIGILHTSATDTINKLKLWQKDIAYKTCRKDGYYYNDPSR